MTHSTDIVTSLYVSYTAQNGNLHIAFPRLCYIWNSECDLESPIRCIPRKRIQTRDQWEVKQSMRCHLPGVDHDRVINVLEQEDELQGQQEAFSVTGRAAPLTAQVCGVT